MSSNDAIWSDLFGPGKEFERRTRGELRPDYYRRLLEGARRFEAQGDMVRAMALLTQARYVTSAMEQGRRETERRFTATASSPSTTGLSAQAAIDLTADDTSVHSHLRSRPLPQRVNVNEMLGLGIDDLRQEIADLENATVNMRMQLQMVEAAPPSEQVAEEDGPVAGTGGDTSGKGKGRADTT